MNRESRDEDQLLRAEVLDLLEQDTKLADDAKYVIFAAMEGDSEFADALDGATSAVLPQAVEVAPGAEPVGAFLKSISVRGFRGIGPKAALALHPAPGLTVIAGRNGSGKSSFSEGLELAITGTTYRWEAKKSKAWAANWRNLHDGSSCEVEVELAEDGVGLTKIGAAWVDGVELNEPTIWVQRPGKDREPGTASLGWAKALTVYRPILSYDELGGLLEATPSTLFDRLDALLGLDLFIEAQNRVTAVLKEIEQPEKQAKVAATALKQSLAGVDDERATQAVTLLKQRSPDLDAAQALATGTSAEPPADLAALKSLAVLGVPAIDEVMSIVSKLRDAHEAFIAANTVSVEQAERRMTLLQQALEFHQHEGDVHCPVCGAGRLDARWRQQAEQELVGERADISRRRAARSVLNSAQSSVVELTKAVVRPTPPEHLTLASLPAALAAWRRWSSLPTDAVGLATALPAAHAGLAESFDALRDEAARMLTEREDAWAPFALRLADWVQLARVAAANKPIVERVNAAAAFMVGAGKTLRQARLAGVEAKAREIWAALRQDSNVDLGGIELVGQGTRRHVELRAAVDGADAGALGVMSQGELHALALALFLPRATMPGSPFRFIVLDDPIQAMDPAKVDGFVRVMTGLSRYRQVVVLSHDDRLPEVIRRLGVDVRILEVSRTENSLVTIANCEDPAQRYLNDAFALVSDKHLPADVRTRVLPAMCRMAVEAAARDRYFARCFSAGTARAEVESGWNDATTAAQRLALAIHGDATADLGPWLDRAAHRRPAHRTITKGAHQGLARDPKHAVREVEKFVDDVRAGAK